MSPRNKQLEQAKPKGDSPAKVSARKFPPPKSAMKTGKFGSKRLPSGTVEQHKMKPGITSAQ